VVLRNSQRILLIARARRLSYRYSRKVLHCLLGMSFAANLDRLESFAGVSRVKFNGFKFFRFFTVALDFQRYFENLPVVNCEVVQKILEDIFVNSCLEKVFFARIFEEVRMVLWAVICCLLINNSEGL
jgi:hypothetical protein